MKAQEDVQEYRISSSQYGKIHVGNPVRVNKHVKEQVTSQILELSDNDIKTVITVLHMLETLSTDMENIKRDPN